MAGEAILFREQLANVVGSENVITDAKSLKEYSRDQSFVQPAIPLCVVRPKTSDEVQSIVKICNYHKIPLTPYTTGCNNQGAAIPALGGIIIDVSRINKVLEIDPVSRNAHIEVGVTFEQLLDAAEKTKTEFSPYGLRPAVPVELPVSASVLVSLLEYNPTWTWSRYAGDENEILTIPRLVLPTGEVMKTGLAAIPFVKKPIMDVAGVPATFVNKIFFGAQGTFGIALEAWVKLMSRREVNKVFFWSLNKPEEAFNLIREIKWLRYGFELFMINKMELALMLAENLAEEIAGLRDALPSWTLVLILRGRADEVEYQEEDLKELAAKLGMKILTEIPGVAEANEKIILNVEYPQGWKKTARYKGARNVIPFITPQKRISMFNEAIFTLSKKYQYPVENIGCLAIPAYQEPGIIHYQYSFARDPNDAEETERVKEMFYEASESLIHLGAFFSRPYGRWAEMVYARAGTYHTIIKEFKQIIDPNNIMNPGKLLF